MINSTASNVLDRFNKEAEQLAIHARQHEHASAGAEEILARLTAEDNQDRAQLAEMELRARELKARIDERAPRLAEVKAEQDGEAAEAERLRGEAAYAIAIVERERARVTTTGPMPAVTQPEGVQA